MDNRVISQIAQEIFYTRTNTPEALRGPRSESSSAHMQTKKASAYVNSVTVLTSPDAARKYELHQLQEKVQRRDYNLDQKVINDIAEKIVQMLT